MQSPASAGRFASRRVANAAHAAVSSEFCPMTAATSTPGKDRITNDARRGLASRSRSPVSAPTLFAYASRPSAQNSSSDGK